KRFLSLRKTHAQCACCRHRALQSHPPEFGRAIRQASCQIDRERNIVALENGGGDGEVVPIAVIEREDGETLRGIARDEPPDGLIEADAIIAKFAHAADRSEEHTSELQSRENLVCRLLL